jgi:hypothetical protein
MVFVKHNSTQRPQDDPETIPPSKVNELGRPGQELLDRNAVRGVAEYIGEILVEVQPFSLTV